MKGQNGEYAMLNFLPAILIGGPPHAGKSVLLYWLTQALRQKGIQHYALRANADGEGNWYHESNPELASTLVVKLTSEWPPVFVQSIRQAQENRSLPFLVDMGGHPRPSQECLLQGCTHAILLLREDLPEESRRWEQLIEKYHLLPLARIVSHRGGGSAITTTSPILEGVISGLERDAALAGAGTDPLFAALYAQIEKMCTVYDVQQVIARHLASARTELMLDLPQELSQISPDESRWQPDMLPQVLARLPEDLPLSVYGIGPGWLYAALAAYEDPHPFYLFDPKVPFGWIEPVAVALSANPGSQEDIDISLTRAPTASLLKISFPADRLDYLRPEPLLFPPAPLEAGLIIDGRAPYWLLTSLVRLYKQASLPWIATFYPPLGQAVVVFSARESPRPGDLVPRPAG